MTDRKGNWMQVWTGGRYYPMDPRVEEVRIEDIAHSLAMQCRFTGHVETFYSVAEHSWWVSHLVPSQLALCGLLHDATEAYLTDISRPVKAHLTNYKEIEALNWKVIAMKFNLPAIMPPEIHRADNAMLHAERAKLLKFGPADASAEDWAMGAVESPAKVRIKCWGPGRGKQKFLERFYQLTWI